MKKDFYPTYTHVGNTEIFKSSDIKIGTVRSGYFHDTNCKVHFYNNVVHITDLTNAMKRGQVCSVRSISPTGAAANSLAEFTILLREKSINTFADLISTDEIEGFQTKTYAENAARTFSPFAEVKPIKRPKDWTRTHVAKAILSGQVFDGTINARYTDDYAYDAQMNFGKGQKVDLFELARELIEDGPRGIMITEEEAGDVCAKLILSWIGYT